MAWQAVLPHSARAQKRSDSQSENVTVIYRWAEEAFAWNDRQRPDALFVGGTAFLNIRRVQRAQLAAFHRLPATYSQREIAEVGGLMSYGANVNDAFRQLGVYAG